MELRFTQHALWRIDVRQISVADVEEAITSPDKITEDAAAFRYDKTLSEGILRVVISKTVPDPPLVVTVMWLRA